MSKTDKPLRARLMGALHSEGVKRGFDHDRLRELCGERYGVESMKDLSIDQMDDLFKHWLGRRFPRARRTAARPPLPARGAAQESVSEIVSPQHLETLGRAFGMRGWGPKTKREFIRRQLGGREQIRTKADFQKVFRGVQAINRRDGIAGA